MKLAERLYEQRKLHGMSQEKLAEALNVSRQSVSRWEMGTVSPTVENMVAISELYKMSIDELLCGESMEKQTIEPAKGKPRKHSNWNGLIWCILTFIITAAFLTIFVFSHAPATALLILLLVITSLVVGAVLAVLTKALAKTKEKKFEAE